jgi:hypothetical protein
MVKDSECIYVTPIDYFLYSMCDAFMYSDRVFPTRPNELEAIAKAVSQMDPDKKRLLVVLGSDGLSDHVQTMIYSIEAQRIVQYTETHAACRATFVLHAIHGNYFYDVFELTPDQ